MNVFIIVVDVVVRAKLIVEHQTHKTIIILIIIIISILVIVIYNISFQLNNNKYIE